MEDAGVEEVERVVEEALRDAARGPRVEERVARDALEGRRGVRQHRGRRLEDDDREGREARDGDDDAAAHGRAMVSNRRGVCYVAPRMRGSGRHASAR
jgi:hypothetical protein